MVVGVGVGAVVIYYIADSRLRIEAGAVRGETRDAQQQSASISDTKPNFKQK